MMMSTINMDTILTKITPDEDTIDWRIESLGHEQKL